MTSPKVLQLIALAEEFEQKTIVTGPDKGEYNRKFQAQREMLAKFYDSFRSELRSTMGQMEGDLATLRERHFDKAMLALLAKVYRHLEEIYQHLTPEKPYKAAEELVNFVNERHQRSVIDNLQFLAKHHLEKTKPETLAPLPATVRHITEAKSLSMLKELAAEVRAHMDQFPLIDGLTPTPIPPRMEPSILGPEEKAGPQDVTKV